MNQDKTMREIEKFSLLADDWWKADGSMAMLHRMNPLRLRYIKDFVTLLNKCINDIRVLDVGCGGGILSIPAAKIGLNVTGIDLSEKLIGAAKHKLFEESEECDIRESCRFICTSVEKHLNDVIKNDERLYDMIFLSEILEHVDDIRGFLGICDKLLCSGGLIFISTINRTVKSLLQAKIFAEYVFSLVKKGTHDWRQFLKPYDVIGALSSYGKYAVIDISGVHFDVIRQKFKMHQDLSVNYFMMLQKMDE